MQRGLLEFTLVLVPSTAWAGELPVAPGEDFCAVIASAQPGDEVVLAPGDYDGPCVISNGGEQGNPIVVRGDDPNDRPRINYSGSSSNVIDVTTSDVVIRGLHFGPSNDAIDGVEIKSGDRIHVENCEFEGIGGISISANSADSDGIEIRGNRLANLDATGIYLGCHDGMASCSARNYVIEGNLIDGVDSAAVGYGLEVKLDSHGVVRDNVINDTKGPGIEIFGSVDSSRVNLVEGNLVLGSRTSGTIEIGGGPAIVRNNIAIGGSTAAIYLYDYGGNDVDRDVRVLGNTAVGDDGPAISASGWAADRGLELSDNAAWQRAGSGPALPGSIAGVTMEGNVDCSDPATCWVDADARDFWPVDGGPLVSDGAAVMDLADDFCGQSRGSPQHVGALERTDADSPGALAIDFKSTFACAGGGGSDTTGGDDDGTGGGDAGSDGDGGSDGGSDATGSAEAGGDGDGSDDGTGGSGGSGTDDGSGCGCTSATDERPIDATVGLLCLLLVSRRQRAHGVH